VGSDLADCRGAVKQLAVTNPHLPGRGRILITRESSTRTVKTTWENWIPLRDNTGYSNPPGASPTYSTARTAHHKEPTPK
jgi:hypothetical protein